MEKNNSKTLLTLMSLCVCLSIITLGLVIYDRFIKEEPEHAILKPIEIVPNTNDNKQNNDSNNNKTTPTNSNVGKNNTSGLRDYEGKDASINYEQLEKTLISKVNSKQEKIILQNCVNCKDIDFDNYDKAKCTKKELSVSSISQILNKLKSANLVEYVSASKPCSEYTYSVGSDFDAFEADDKSILLVGVNGNGYAFHFNNENVTDFLSKLK